MSDVTDIRCAVSRGDLPGASDAFFGLSASSLAWMGTPGTLGVGESDLASCAVEDEDSRLLMRERDRDRSECESGRGVFSDASSKLSCIDMTNVSFT